MNISAWEEDGDGIGNLCDCDLNQDNLRRWLQNTQAMKPGNDMKNVNLSPDQIDALIAYLSTLD